MSTESTIHRRVQDNYLLTIYNCISSNISNDDSFLLTPSSRMNTESVIEFLRNVPLLQRLPNSSLKKIADVVVFKRYEIGDFVVREDQDVDGVYFLLEGEAQVLGSDGGEENCSEFLLKRFDFFGYGIFGNVYPADVIAVSELTCLVLPSDHYGLLKKDSDKELETVSLVERILHLDPLDLNIFQGFTLPDAPTFGKVYGGQFVGQALAAATKTVDSLKRVHNLHSYFLRVGDLDIPIDYEVYRIRDGKSFAIRRVDAKQKGRILFTLFASFQREEEGLVHQDSTIPPVLPPESLIPREEMRERRKTDPRLPRDYRNRVATENFAEWPIDIRFCEPNYTTPQTKLPPRLKYWFRVKGKLSDDQALHRCALAYVSDFMFAFVSMHPHRRSGLTASSLSLDHSIWFHRPLKADDWLLFVIVSPIATGSRGFAIGEMFNRKGELVVTLTQEALLKESVTPKRTFGAKL